MNGWVLPVAAGAAMVLVAPVRRRALSTGAAVLHASAGVVAASVQGAGEILRAAVTGAGGPPRAAG